MGGHSSKAIPEAAPRSSVGGDEGGSSSSTRGSSAGADSLRHDGPIHCLCALGEHSILSGGTDKVKVFHPSTVHQ